MPCCSQEITDGRGVDVAIEALGKALTFSQCAKSVRDGGKAVMIGLAAVNVMGEIDITRLVRRQVRNRLASTFVLHRMHGSLFILSCLLGTR